MAIVAAAGVTASWECAWARGLGSTTSFGFYNTAVQCCWPWDFTVWPLRCTTLNRKGHLGSKSERLPSKREERQETEERVRGRYSKRLCLLALDTKRRQEASSQHSDIAINRSLPHVVVFPPFRWFIAAVFGGAPTELFFCPSLCPNYKLQNLCPQSLCYPTITADRNSTSTIFRIKKRMSEKTEDVRVKRDCNNLNVARSLSWA